MSNDEPGDAKSVAPKPSSLSHFELEYQINIRSRALELALTHYDPDSAMDDVLARARAFASFLLGGSSADA